MKKRTQQKINTRDTILSVSKGLFLKKGVINTTTIEISQGCKIAHGTLFAHFENRDLLVSTLFDKELKRIAMILKDLEVGKIKPLELLKQYLDMLEQEEEFMALIAREFPFFSKKLQRDILSVEVIIRNLFFQCIAADLKRHKTQVEITNLLTVLFGLIHYFLVRKEIFIEKGSVIHLKRKIILNTLITFLN